MKEKKRLTSEEASNELGLCQRGNEVFSLPGILITILSAGLQVQVVNPEMQGPHDPIKTTLSFEYHTNGREYYLFNEAGQLVIERTVPVTRSSRIE